MKQILKRILLAGLYVAPLIVAGVIVYNRQSITDWWYLRDYQPLPAIEMLSDNLTLTDAAERVFYVNDPTLLDKANFNTVCRKFESTIILGCFTSPRGIYVLEVEDERLAGIEEVTAAHELLHAVYDRLDGHTREEVDQLVAEAYASVTEQRIIDTVALYEKQDPSSVPNELHSIIGTEVANLSPELEAHYANVFADRAAVVAYANKYADAFVQREAQIAKFDQQLSEIEATIEQVNQQLESLGDAIAQERGRLTNLRNNGEIAAYNAGVPGFNQQINEYSTTRSQQIARIESFNSILRKRNAIAVEERELIDAINSTVPAIE